MRKIWLILLLALIAATPGPARAQDEGDGDLVKALIESEDAEERTRAAMKLSRTAPNTLADALEDMVKEKRPEDARVLADAAVMVKPPHIRLLMVHMASELEGASDAFAGKIDNDHPWESIRALEALGFLKAQDKVDKVMFSLRSDNELVAVAAARALARIATKRDAKEIVSAALEVDNEHVRQHLAWALRDAMGSARSAAGQFARLAGKPGTMGFRAKEALAVLEDDESQPENYKVKLKDIEDFFGKRVAQRLPEIDGPDEYVPEIEEALKDLQRAAPDWYHLICASVRKITLSGNEWIFEFKTGTLNLRLRDIVNWKDMEGKLRPQLVCYYVIRFATIMFYEKMGDPGEGHRGWEEGCMAAWHYAMDYTKIAVDEDPLKFIQGIINSRPPPW